MIALLLMFACADKAEDSGTEIEADPATFTEVRDDILLLSCAFSSCHGDQGAGGLTFDEEGSYDALVNSPSSAIPGETLVIPGDSAGSYLIKKLEGAEGIDGDEMPPGTSLGVPKIDRVKSWIDDGAQDN
jgi:hypothetical protein